MHTKIIHNIQSINCLDLVFLLSDTTCNTSAGQWECPGNGSYVFCINETQKCDGVRNCPFGEDERTGLCPPSEWNQMDVLV